MKAKTLDTQHVLSTTARSAIVSTFVQALHACDNTGSLVTQVCDTANKYLHGAEISKQDTDSITNSIAKERKWKDKILTARSSEVRVVLRAYNTLPEAIKLYSARANKCDWHTSMRLARKLNAGEKVSAAVRSAFEVAATKVVSPAGRTAGALKAWYNNAKGEKREAILKAAVLLGIKLGVKLDA